MRLFHAVRLFDTQEYLFIQFINSFLLHDYENRKTNKYIIVSGKLNLAYLIPNLHSAFNDSFYSISIL